MSKARLVITAVTVENRPVGEVARAYGVARSWIYTLLARYQAEGEAAFEPRSRQPKTSPAAISDAVVELIVALRKELAGRGLDAGPHTIAWHLRHHHQLMVSPATISRYLTRRGLVTPEPRKRPKSSYLRFAAELPNECWQSDFTHYRLTRPDGRPGSDTEILGWLDDHSRLILHLTAHHRVTGPIVLAAFRATCAEHGIPASTLTDNGTVYRPRAVPGSRNTDTHDRVRADRVDTDGKLTLRHNGRLYHIGIGRTHARTRVLMLVHDLDIRVINAATGELLRQLTLDPTRNYQPTGRPPGPPPGRPRKKPNPEP
jgi:transposase